MRFGNVSHHELSEALDDPFTGRQRTAGAVMPADKHGVDSQIGRDTDPIISLIPGQQLFIPVEYDAVFHPADIMGQLPRIAGIDREGQGFTLQVRQLRILPEARHHCSPVFRCVGLPSRDEFLGRTHLLCHSRLLDG